MPPTFRGADALPAPPIDDCVMATASHAMEDACPCDSGYPFAACCAPYLAGLAPAPTAETLMRSRYTACALGRADYLRDTWHPSTRPASVTIDARQQWLGLRVEKVVAGAKGDRDGKVEFVARFKLAGRGHRIHEVSRFRCEDSRWYYLDGDVRQR